MFIGKLYLMFCAQLYRIPPSDCQNNSRFTWCGCILEISGKNRIHEEYQI